LEADKLLLDVPAGSEYFRLESLLNVRAEMEDDTRGEHYPSAPRDRFANNVLARLYKSRKFTTGMVFSRLLSRRTTRMVNGVLLPTPRTLVKIPRKLSKVVQHIGARVSI
jgi:hypothetical protein